MDVQRAILEGFATFFGGAVATVLFLLPGYVIGKAYSGGIRSPTPSDRAFLTTIASGGLLVHLIALPWTAPLAQYVIEKLPDLDLAHYLEVLAWSDVYLERTWPVDRHGQPKAASDKTENVPNKGIWVAGSEIMTVEFVPKQRRRREA